MLPMLILDKIEWITVSIQSSLVKPEPCSPVPHSAIPNKYHIFIILQLKDFFFFYKTLNFLYNYLWQMETFFQTFPLEWKTIGVKNT